MKKNLLFPDVRDSGLFSRYTNGMKKSTQPLSSIREATTIKRAISKIFYDLLYLFLKKDVNLPYKRILSV
jgi:hypothetical protein